MDQHFTYNGYQYCTWEDVEPDNIKIFHECYRDGRRINMPSEFYNHSPYELMPFDKFCNHVQNIQVFIQG